MVLPEVDLSLAGALLAAVLFTALALQIAVRPGWRGGSEPRPARLFTLAIAASATWGWAAVLRAGSGTVPLEVVEALDLLRYAGWFAFLLSLIPPAGARPSRSIIGWLKPMAVLLIIGAALGLLVEPWLAVADAPPSRIALIASLALPVFGLILVEQLFANAVEDARWSAKPLCLGLTVLFATDFYLYAQGLLFGGIDPDAISARGTIHALTVPLLFVALRRQRGVGLGRLRVSRSAVFHSTALLLAGGYLLAVAAIGYYVRDFGGSWGGALQQILLAAALIALATLAISGAMRSRLRVWIGRNFFRYRYDYRDEWLRFTERLSGLQRGGRDGRTGGAGDGRHGREPRPVRSGPAPPAMATTCRPRAGMLPSRSSASRADRHSANGCGGRAGSSISASRHPTPMRPRRCPHGSAPRSRKAPPAGGSSCRWSSPTN